MLKNNLLIMTKFGFPKITLKTFASLASVVIVLAFKMLSCKVQSDDKLKEEFKNPPDFAKP